MSCLRLWCIAALLVCAAPSAARADSTRFTADQAHRDLRILKRALTELHPGLYRYITPATVDSAFAREMSLADSGATRAELFLAAARLAAMVRCGHTMAGFYNQSEAMNLVVRDGADKLPLHLACVERRLVVTGSVTDGAARGDELLAIDGRPAGTIVDEMLRYTRADGSNDGKRLHQLTHINGRSALDLYFPALHPPGAAGYTLTLRALPGGAPRTVTVPGITLAARESLFAARGAAAETSEAWSFRIDGRTAWWTMPTFAFWQGEFDWRGEIARRFDEMRAAKVTTLILDIRRNEGGDDAINDSLLVHLIRQPVTLPASRPVGCYERVPYVLARFLDTWDFDFFDRTGRVVPMGGRDYILAGRDTSDTVLRPCAQPFTGRTFVLIGPENSSATFLLARALKRTGAATLVGRTTGGNQRGINGGELAWVTLPNSGAAVDIPLIAWMPRTPQPDAGLDPDIAVRWRAEDIAAGIDPDVRAVCKAAGVRPVAAR